MKCETKVGWVIAALATACMGAAPAKPADVPASSLQDTLAPKRISTAEDAPSTLNQPCAPGQNLRSSDLCAQWQAADAASASATWTARTFWLSLFGTVFGAGTLIAAFMAATYAKHAASEARRSADIARESYVAAERAWLTVALYPDSDLTYHETGGCSLRVYLTIKNIGRTPALNVHTSMTIVPMKQDHVNEVADYALEQRERNTNWSRTLVPGDSYDRTWGLSLDYYSESPYATIFGCVTYETLPDRTIHQTAFCYIVGRKEHGFLDGIDTTKEDIVFTVTSGGFAD